MTERKTIKLWLAVNEMGDSRIGWDSASDALEVLRDDDGYEVARVVEINVTLDLPEVEAAVANVTIPAETKTGAKVEVTVS